MVGQEEQEMPTVLLIQEAIVRGGDRLTERPAKMLSSSKTNASDHYHEKVRRK